MHQCQAGAPVDDLLDPVVLAALRAHRTAYRVMPCAAEHADTAAFCAHYGVPLAQAANTIIVASRRVVPPRYATCVALATTRLDVNHTIKDLLGVARASFAEAHITCTVTGMMIGGVTPFGIPDLPLYVDAAVMEQPEVVLGGGNRSSKLLLPPAELLPLGAVVVPGLAHQR